MMITHVAPRASLPMLRGRHLCITPVAKCTPKLDVISCYRLLNLHQLREPLVLYANTVHMQISQTANQPRTGRDRVKCSTSHLYAMVRKSITPVKGAVSITIPNLKFPLFSNTVKLSRQLNHKSTQSTYRSTPHENMNQSVAAVHAKQAHTCPNNPTELVNRRSRMSYYQRSKSQHGPFPHVAPHRPPDSTCMLDPCMPADIIPGFTKHIYCSNHILWRRTYHDLKCMQTTKS